MTRLLTALALTAVICISASARAAVHEFRPQLACSMQPTWRNTEHIYRRQRDGNRWWVYFHGSTCSFGVARMRVLDNGQYLRARSTPQKLKCRASARNERETPEPPCQY